MNYYSATNILSHWAGGDEENSSAAYNPTAWRHIISVSHRELEHVTPTALTIKMALEAKRIAVEKAIGYASQYLTSSMGHLAAEHKTKVLAELERLLRYDNPEEVQYYHRLVKVLSRKRHGTGVQRLASGKRVSYDLSASLGGARSAWWALGCAQMMATDPRGYWWPDNPSRGYASRFMISIGAMDRSKYELLEASALWVAWLYVHDEVGANPNHGLRPVEQVPSALLDEARVEAQREMLRLWSRRMLKWISSR
jgi:hypothetical protein